MEKEPILRCLKATDVKVPEMRELKVNPEYEGVLPKLPAEEYEALSESIRVEGLHYPIVVNEEGIILDGYHRYRICRELGIIPNVEVKTFGNKLQEKKFVIQANLRRRHLNDFQKAELAYSLLEIERALARERQKRTQFGFGGVQMNTTGKGKARDIVAKAAGLSPTTFQRAVKIIERGPEKLKEKVRHGKMSIAYAYKMILREEKNCKTPDMPSGKFNVIYADPPWEYYLPLRGSPDMHYKTMSTDEICKLSVPAADNAVLFLWATNPMLEDALKVMAAWGFKYKTNMVWVKSQIGTGSYFRGQHELLLLGVKGDVHPPEESKRLPSVLFADTQRHSEKPEEVYTIIEHMYPGRRYLELFARKRREGWVSWGDEIQP